MYLLVLVALIFDQGSKFAALSWFPGLIQFNRGSAFTWGIPVHISIAISVIVAILFFRHLVIRTKLSHSVRKESTKFSHAIRRLADESKILIETWWAAIFVSGAVANALDRIVWGGVIDWIHYPFGITGNIADLYLLAGLFGFLRARSTH